MRKSTILFVCVTVWALSSCSPKVTSNVVHRVNPQPSIDDVVMLGEKEPVPADAQWMGSVEVKGSANYEKMAQITRVRAWSDGAKYVKVNSFATDGVRSDIHVMNSNLYWADNTKVNADDIKVIDREGNVVSAYNGESGSQAATPEYVSPLQKLGYNSFRVYAGYGRRLNRMSPSLDMFQKQHFKRLLNGEILGAEYIRYFDKRSDGGLGFRYQIMHASSADAGAMKDENCNVVNGILDETVNISFAGPIYAGRFVSRNGKHLFADNVGLGVVTWKDKLAFNEKNILAKGNTLGWTFDFNYSYFLSDHVTLGADLSYTSGVIRKVTLTDGTQTVTQQLSKEDYEGVVHLGICAQLVYTF